MSVAIYAILGVFLRRWFGGGIPSLNVPHIVKLLALCGLAGWLAYLSGGLWLGVIVAFLTWPFWSMGHGSYMDMGTNPLKDDERFRYILIYLFGEEAKPSMWRDFAGMTIRYSIPAALIGAVYACFGIWNGLWLVLVGLGIATAYWCFMRLRGRLPHKGIFLDGFTAYGELAAGAIFYGTLALIAG